MVMNQSKFRKLQAYTLGERRKLIVSSGPKRCFTEARFQRRLWRPQGTVTKDAAAIHQEVNIDGTQHHLEELQEGSIADLCLARDPFLKVTNEQRTKLETLGFRILWEEAATTKVPHPKSAKEKAEIKRNENSATPIFFVLRHHSEEESHAT